MLDRIHKWVSSIIQLPSFHHKTLPEADQGIIKWYISINALPALVALSLALGSILF